MRRARNFVKLINCTLTHLNMHRMQERDSHSSKFVCSWVGAGGGGGGETQRVSFQSAS